MRTLTKFDLCFPFWVFEQCRGSVAVPACSAPKKCHYKGPPPMSKVFFVPLCRSMLRLSPHGIDNNYRMLKRGRRRARRWAALLNCAQPCRLFNSSLIFRDCKIPASHTSRGKIPLTRHHTSLLLQSWNLHVNTCCPGTHFSSCGPVVKECKVPSYEPQCSQQEFWWDLLLQLVSFLSILISSNLSEIELFN